MGKEILSSYYDVLWRSQFISWVCGEEGRRKGLNIED
jgi:hypothetical protein